MFNIPSIARSQTAMVARSLMVGTLITMAVVVSSYRYDIFVLNNYKIKKEDISRTERAESLCACRRRCVEDDSCAAVAAVRVGKAFDFECHFSETKAPTSSVEGAGGGYVTIFKERKPKVYFWSSEKTASAADEAAFWNLCSAEEGRPGVVLSWGDYQYVKYNLTFRAQDEGGLIPLKSKIANEETGQKHTWWIGLSFPFQDSSPLKSSYKDGSKDELCHRITRTNNMVAVEAKSCEGSEAPVLCYKYDQELNSP